MRSLTRAFWLLSVAWLSAACLDQQPTDPDADGDTKQDPKAPGEVLGFFGLSGGLQDDTCGAELMGAPDTWSFQVKLSRRGEALYWLNGKEGIVGEIDDEGAFSFETRVDTKVTERRGAAKGCTIQRRDSAQGVLDEAKGSLSVKLGYAYDQTSDSDCGPLLIGSPGVPQEVPCKMSYALSGKRLSD
jgi:hypothetical protein